jgi:hypothetical protein
VFSFGRTTLISVLRCQIWALHVLDYPIWMMKQDNLFDYADFFWISHVVLDVGGLLAGIITCVK